MADLTLAQRFGSNASIQFNPDNSKYLVIDLANLQDQTEGGDFTNGLGLDTSAIDDTNGSEYASKILWALIGLSQQNQPENNNDEAVGIYISSQGKRPVNRNGMAQFGYLTVVTGYQDDNSGLTLDPDNMRSNFGSTQS